MKIMLPILQNLLHQEYPTLYTNRPNSKKTVFECGDGWFTLIDTVSDLIVKRSSITFIEQIKGTYGSLSVNISGYAPADYDYIFGIASMSYWLSQIICEKCARKGTMFNTFGVTARCELHDNGHRHHILCDETADLPFQMKISGSMWRLMILEFYHLIQLHIESNDMPNVDIRCADKVNDKLSIEFTGGDEVTHGMLALLSAYAARIDEKTGDVLS